MKENQDGQKNITELITKGRKQRLNDSTNFQHSKKREIEFRYPIHEKTHPVLLSYLQIP